jgi:hypothetical protein
MQGSEASNFGIKPAALRAAADTGVRPTQNHWRIVAWRVCLRVVDVSESEQTPS